ncbi:DUF397 domain-containing protein [Spirillospora sp. CA-253888]
MTRDLSGERWTKSGHSGGGQDCVEVARALPEAVAVRDSKDPRGPVLLLGADAWRALTARLRVGG